MLPNRTVTYPDALFFSVLKGAINGATSIVEVATFLFRTGYQGETRAQEIAQALKAAKARGCRVLVVLNYSRFERDICVENYATGQDLAAAGCEVRMGPVNQTMHTKLAIIDLAHVFIGSHNLTRGALSFNRELTVYSRTREMVGRACQYYNDLWSVSKPINQVTPPTEMEKVEIDLLTVTTEGAALKATFEVNQTAGVDAFAAVVATQANLLGAVMGETVGLPGPPFPATAEARVTPTVEPGTEVYVAVRAYAQGQAIATSDKVRLVYQPAEGGGEGEGGGGGEEPPPPEPLTAPTLTSAVWASPTEVALTWEFVGCANFHHFAIERRNLEQVWELIGSCYDASARQWTGEAAGSTEATPFRVVVTNQAGASAASNALAVEGEPPVVLEAPVLTTVQQTGPTDINVEWTYTTPPNFHRFEVQQRANGTWQVVGTTQDPTARTWSGGPVAFMDDQHPVRVVVFDMQERSAASNEMTITLLPTLQAPVLTVVETVTLEQIHVEWTYETLENFHRFEIEQRVAEATWQAIATVTDPAARSWNGPAPIMDDVHPIRVVVFNTAEQSAASNEMPIVLTVFAPPVPPVIVSITPYEAGVRVVWTWEDSGRFSHFVVQQRDEALVWHDLATVRGPSDREWIGQPLDMSTTHPYRVMVYNVTGESAVSEEGFLTMG